MFFGLGSDGTVGANKASVKIIGEGTDLFAQGYFVYDSKKSGSITVSHLRFGPEPIRSTYLVEGADFVACHQFGLLGRTKVLESRQARRDVPAQRPVRPRRGLGAPARRRPAACSSTRRSTSGSSTRSPSPPRPGWAAASTRSCSRASSSSPGSCRPRRRSRGSRPSSRRPTPSAARPSSRATSRPSTARSSGSGTSRSAPSPTSSRATAPVPDDAPDFVGPVTARLMAGDGDLLPVSALPVDGTFPTGTTKYEKRAIAQTIPIWDPSICIDCGKCAMVCPHATIRMKVFPTAVGRGGAGRLPPQGVQVARPPGPPADDPGRARRLHRLRRVRRRLPGQEQDRLEPQGDQHGAGRRAPRRRAANAGTSSSRSRGSTAMRCRTTPSRARRSSSRCSSSRAPAAAAARRRTSASSASCSATG